MSVKPLFGNDFRTVGIWPIMDHGRCADDSNCSDNGHCLLGQCKCQVDWAGPNCTKHNDVYFHSFSIIFYLLTTISFLQLFFCIRSEYSKQKKKSILAACRLTVQKFLYICTAVACLSRGLLFTLRNVGAIEDRLYTPALCTYYALITSSLALIVCYWCEIFFTEDAAHGAARRPRFLTKSRLAFTIFNSMLIGLLLIHFAASQFYDKASDQPPNMVFPALFATVLLVVHIMFLIVGVEIYCKIRGAFVSENSDRGNVDKVQAIHSRLGIFFQWGLTLLLVIFIISEVAGVPKIMRNVMFRSVYEVTFRLLELGAILWFSCILWNPTNPEQLWALNPKRLLKPMTSGKVDLYEYEACSSESSKTLDKFDCWICYDGSLDSELIRPCQCKGDMAFVHHSCLQRWLSEQQSTEGAAARCRVCNHEYEVSQDTMDFDSALKRIHWALVVPLFVMILIAPYVTYLICRQVEKHDALEKHRTLIQSAAVIVCLLIEYAVLRLLGMSGLKLYRTAANAAVRIQSYPDNQEIKPISPATNRSNDEIVVQETSAEESTTATRV